MNKRTISKRYWLHRLYRLIFEADTPGGKAFEVALFICIILSIFAVVFPGCGAEL
jgi:voltage-gated potassium channel